VQKQARIIVISIFLLAAIGLSLYFRPMLPNCVPVHFNASGAPDGYGPKSALLVLTPAVQAFLAFLYLVSVRVVQTEKYWLKKMRKPLEPAVIQELINRTVRFLDWLFLLCLFLFLDIQFESLLVAAGKMGGLSKLIWIIMPLMFAGVILYLASVISVQRQSGKGR